MSRWLDGASACWTFYRQTSGGVSIAALENGDLDVAMLGSTPFATAAARRAGVTAVSILHFKGAAQALVTRSALVGPADLAGATLYTPYTRARRSRRASTASATSKSATGCPRTAAGRSR